MTLIVKQCLLISEDTQENWATQARVWVRGVWQRRWKGNKEQ